MGGKDVIEEVTEVRGQLCSTLADKLVFPAF